MKVEIKSFRQTNTEEIDHQETYAERMLKEILQAKEK